MSSDTITLELDKYESGVVFHSLKDKRNQMLKEGKDTELVDNVLFKHCMNILPWQMFLTQSLPAFRKECIVDGSGNNINARDN